MKQTLGKLLNVDGRRGKGVTHCLSIRFSVASSHCSQNENNIKKKEGSRDIVLHQNVLLKIKVKWLEMQGWSLHFSTTTNNVGKNVDVQWSYHNMKIIVDGRLGEWVLVSVHLYFANHCTLWKLRVGCENMHCFVIVCLHVHIRASRGEEAILTPYS